MKLSRRANGTSTNGESAKHAAAMMPTSAAVSRRCESVGGTVTMENLASSETLFGGTSSSAVGLSPLVLVEVLIEPAEIAQVAIVAIGVARGLLCDVDVVVASRAAFTDERLRVVRVVDRDRALHRELVRAEIVALDDARALALHRQAGAVEPARCEMRRFDHERRALPMPDREPER